MLINKRINKKDHSGFTLIETIILVLIIAILAIVVPPQYRLLVIKSRYNIIKDITEAFISAGERYYLAKGNRPSKFSDLDCTFDHVAGLDTGMITFPNGTVCTMWCRGNSFPGRSVVFPDGASCIMSGGQYDPTQMRYIACRTKISGVEFAFYQYFPWNENPNECLVWSTDAKDIYNKFCRRETGNTTGQKTYDSIGYKYIKTAKLSSFLF